MLRNEKTTYQKTGIKQKIIVDLFQKAVQNLFSGSKFHEYLNLLSRPWMQFVFAHYIFQM